MTKNVSMLVPVIALLLAVGGHAQQSQEKPEKPAPAAQPQPAQKQLPVVPLKVTIVISRYQGDKKTSSLPFTVSVNTNDRSRASLRLGAKIPVPTSTFASGSAPNVVSYNYQDVGTNIDCTATTLDDGRYRLDLTVDDSSVYGDEPGGQSDTKKFGDHPAFRSFKSTNTLILKDGQSTQYTTATDKVSGEVTKVDITVMTVK